MFGRFKKPEKKAPKKPTSRVSAPEKTAEPERPERKVDSTSDRILTAEGWKRMMLKKK